MSEDKSARGRAVLAIKEITVPGGACPMHGGCPITAILSTFEQDILKGIAEKVGAIEVGDCDRQEYADRKCDKCKEAEDCSVLAGEDAKTAVLALLKENT